MFRRSERLPLEHVTGATGAVEVMSRTAARSLPPTRAGGQDDGTYMNSLKLYLGFVQRHSALGYPKKITLRDKQIFAF